MLCNELPGTSLLGALCVSKNLGFCEKTPIKSDLALKADSKPLILFWLFSVLIACLVFSHTRKSLSDIYDFGTLRDGSAIHQSIDN